MEYSCTSIPHRGVTAAAAGETLKCGMAIDDSGNLYGTTSLGGTDFRGSVYEMVAGSGEITVLATFPGIRARNPKGGLARAADGTLYGTSYAGGPGGIGSVFSVAPGSGTAVMMDAFTGPDGSYGAVVESIEAAIFASAEYRSAHAGSLIASLYVEFLGRPAGANEVASWQTVVSSAGIGAAIRGIHFSEESSIASIGRTFHTFLRRASGQACVSFLSVERATSTRLLDLAVPPRALASSNTSFFTSM